MASKSSKARSEDGATTGTKQIRAAIEEWQRHLLQLDRRNSLLYFKEWSAVRILVDDIDDFIVELSEAKRGLSFLYAERRRRPRSIEASHDDGDLQADEPDILEAPGDIVTDLPPMELQKRLHKLMKNDLMFEQEQGLNVLFLAIGVLKWIDADGEVARSPLLLIPCDLKWSPRNPYTLQRDEDDITANGTLVHQMSREGISLPGVSPDQAPSDFLRNVEAVIRGRQGWEVQRDVYLSTFHYSKLAMWEDLERMREEGVEHELVKVLCGVKAETDDPSPKTSSRPWSDEELAGGLLDDVLDERGRPLTVLPADFSQLRAIEAARSGRHLLVHGPPGTGKSQTIANMISALMADGKRVLFVAEKTAALDVVKRRLDQRSLGVFCLDLHSERGRKNNVYAQLRNSLEAPRENVGDTFDYDQLKRRRDWLNAYVRELHQRREPLGWTIYKAQGRLSLLRDVKDVEFRGPVPSLLDQQTLDDWVWLGSRISQRPDEYRHHFDSRWRCLKDVPITADLPDRIRRAVVGLRGQLSAAKSEAAALASFLGVSEPNSHASLARLMPFIDHFKFAPAVPAEWVTGLDLTVLVETARRQMNAQSARADQVKAASKCFRVPLTPFGYADLAKRLPAPSDMAERASALLSSDWSRQIATDVEAVNSRLRAVAGSAERVISTEGRLSSVIEAPGTPWPSSAALGIHEEALESLTTLIDFAPVPRSWIADSLDRLRRGISNLEERWRGLEKLESRLFEAYSEAILDSVDKDMLIRFRTDYRSRLRFLNSGFRRDEKLIRGLRRDAKKRSVELTTDDIELAVKINELRADLASLEENGEQLLGSWYEGRQTQWDGAVSAVESVKGRRPWAPITPALGAVLVGDSPLAPLRTLIDEAKRDLDVYTACCADLNEQLISSNAAVDAVGRMASELLEQTTECAAAIEELKDQWKEPPSSLEVLADCLAAAAKVEAFDLELARQGDQMSADFGERYAANETDWNDVLGALEWTLNAIEMAPEGAEGWHKHAIAPVSAEEYESAVARGKSLRNEFDSSARDWGEMFDEPSTGLGPWADAMWVEMTRWCEDIEDHADEASGWLQYRQVVAEADQLSPGMIDEIRRVVEDAGQVPLVVERRLITNWLTSVMSDTPALRAFGRQEHDAIVAEFKQLDVESMDSAAREIRRRLLTRYPDPNVTISHAGQIGVLRDQLSRKRRQLPVRQLLSRVPDVVQTLKPCFMMSPLAVSQFLPRGDDGGAKFDTVVFDEASQVFPEDAVPAIARGAQLIVVGDEQQLPPTSFFRRAFDGDEDADDEEDPDEPGDALAGRDSILDVMVGMLGRSVSERYLRIHYRSRHEALIRFSNHYFYKNRLVVFPSPYSSGSGHGISSLYVEDARYDAGKAKSRTNRREAERVVDVAFGLMRTRPSDESIGIAALSRPQADLIELLLNERRVQEPDVEFRFDESATEPVFVKNLENVQGDERDHIIISIGYGPTVATGQVPNRFGPINTEGGHRRLNVLVTRARKSVTIVHSLRATDIRANGQGPRLLKRYLEYANDPATALESEAHESDAAEVESEFEAAVLEALTALGHRVGKQIGVAGYRIDLAIRSEDGDDYDLGIECDGATYHSSPAARDRDWLRQSILEGLGWRIHRVWSTAWFRNPKAEIAAIEEALARSQSTSKEQSPVQSSTKADIEFEPPVPITAAPTEGARPQLFPVYKRASLTDLPTGDNLQTASYNRLLLMFDRILESEEPAHFDTIVERVRQRFGMSRARQASRDNVWAALARAAQEKRVVMVEGHSPGDAFFRRQGAVISHPRCPSSDTERRAIQHISLIEIKAGLIRVAHATFGCNRQDLATEVARQFGFDRTGSDIQKRIDVAVASAIKEGSLVESGDMITVRDSTR